MGGFSSSGKYTIPMPKRHVVFTFPCKIRDERKYIKRIYGQLGHNVCKDIKNGKWK